MKAYNIVLISLLTSPRMVFCADGEMSPRDVEALHDKVLEGLSFGSQRSLEGANETFPPDDLVARVDSVKNNSITVLAGTDDAVRPGQCLIVKRDGRGIAVVSVVEASPDVARAVVLRVIDGWPRAGDTAMPVGTPSRCPRSCTVPHRCGRRPSILKRGRHGLGRIICRGR